MRFKISGDKIFILTYFSMVIFSGSVALSLPIAWAGPKPLAYIDALFTSTSAVCVTGLIVVDTAMYTAFGKIAIMMLIQAGGLGVVAFAMIYIALPRRKISLVNGGVIKDLYIDEIESNPKHIIRNIIITTGIIETIGALILAVRFGSLGVRHPIFTGLFHSVSAFCNAGFSIFSDNLESYVHDPYVNLAIMGLIITGGIGFLVIQDMERFVLRKQRRISYHSKIVLLTTGALVFFGAAMIYLLEYDGAFRGFTVWEKALAAFFHSVTPRTAGFDTVLPSTFGMGSTLIVMLLMIVGGSPGSTAGGIKTTTFFVALFAGMRGTERDGRVETNGGAIDRETVMKAFAVVTKAAVIILVSVFLLLVSGSPGVSPHGRFVDLLYETLSAFGTVGLSLGATPVLTFFGKTVIISTMFIGRIGLFAMSLPVSRARIERYVDYPSEKIMIG